ncbi:WD40 repeat-like protein [Epithele typhae]|uniref:WD40 repeat-like protein n=1 Tax=Epithele typhae TaxID=378194 RepID=UPI0020081060|nr:WD40 repeat-like protein [Epithele typhae]KAH9927131.1 WD40 repeat-like protein [Epithele typhae]
MATLVPAPSFRASGSPIKTAQLPAKSYVLAIASLPSFYAAAASAPSNAVHIFDKERLRLVLSLSEPEAPITALRSVPTVAGSAPQALVSASKDGCVRVWDERAATAALRLTASTAGTPRALLSCDVSSDGLTIAAGTDLKGDDASILYWDPRNPAAPLRTHASTHSDDITALHFYRPPPHAAHAPGLTPRTLLSASSDGLLCTSDAAEADEDEAGVHVGNWGCSVAQAGWVHDRTGAAGVWAASDMETFSVWSSELDRLQDTDIRQPSVHREELSWVTDYLVGCHISSRALAGAPNADNALCVFVGSNEGHISLVSHPTFDDPWLLHRTWTHAHAGVVRAVHWDETAGILLTGGEDGKLNVWTAPVLGPPDGAEGIPRSGRPVAPSIAAALASRKRAPEDEDEGEGMDVDEADDLSDGEMRDDSDPDDAGPSTAPATTRKQRKRQRRRN